MELKAYLEKQKEKCSARLGEIDKELDELAKKNEETDDELELKNIGDSLAELQAEKEELEAELKEVEAQIDALGKPADKPKPQEEPKPEEKPNPERAKFLTFYETRKENQIMTLEERKARAEAFIKNGEKEKLSTTEMRATLVSGGTIATPTEVKGIEPNFNQVSSIVDLVRVENNEGMGSAKYAYEKEISEAKDQTEGSSVETSDPVYGYETMTPESIMVLSQISKQVRKQSPLDYEGKVVDSAEKALRVKVAKYITSKILASTLIDKPAELKIADIDDKTLRKIAFSYGSDETIYGNAWLFLTKKDLIKFGDVRGTNGNKSAVYEITPDTDNPNTGTIKDGGLSVRYCLNPNLTSLASAEEDGVAMFYGQPQCAVLGLFSDYEVQVSEDFAFDKNMLTIRGDAEIGCVVDKYHGFVCVTKGA